MARGGTATRGRGDKKPVWKEVEEQESAKGGNRVRRKAKASRSRRLQRRYVAPYDLQGPKVRLGILWFLLALVALAIGPLPSALLYGAVAAVAAAQTARAWRRRRSAAERPNEAVAAATAMAIALGACLGGGGAGLAILAGVALAYATATGDVRSANRAITDAGWTLQCALPVGIAAMSMVLLARLDQGSAIALLMLVCAYETGDFLVGSGARNPYEGPAAGASAIVVITFIVSTLPISTLSFGEAWLFGGIVAVGAPLGQMAASAMLPAAGSPATALRRLDSLLIVAPVWAWGVGLVA
jgi:hypothetical protein